MRRRGWIAGVLLALGCLGTDVAQALGPGTIVQLVTEEGSVESYTTLGELEAKLGMPLDLAVHSSKTCAGKLVHGDVHERARKAIAILTVLTWTAKDKAALWAGF